MAWTAPRTWVTGETVTAALMNAHISDNFLETSAATVTTAGDIAFADAANSMGSRVAHPGDSGSFLVSTTSSGLAWRLPVKAANWDTGVTTHNGGGFDDTVYGSVIGTVGGGDDTLPDATATTGTDALVIVGCQLTDNSNAGADTSMTYSVSGATTIAAGDTRAVTGEASAANDKFHLSLVFYETSLTAGSNVFQVEAKVSAGQADITRPRIVVIPL